MDDYTASLDTTAVTVKLKILRPIRILSVNNTALERTWDQVVRRHHYLGYSKMYGPRIKYLALHQNRPLAAISYNHAILALV